VAQQAYRTHVAEQISDGFDKISLISTQKVINSSWNKWNMAFFNKIETNSDISEIVKIYFRRRR
jgi:hypothetical protein